MQQKSSLVSFRKHLSQRRSVHFPATNQVTFTEQYTNLQHYGQQPEQAARNMLLNCSQYNLKFGSVEPLAHTRPYGLLQTCAAHQQYTWICTNRAHVHTTCTNEAARLQDIGQSHTRALQTASSARDLGSRGVKQGPGTGVVHDVVHDNDVEQQRKLVLKDNARQFGLAKKLSDITQQYGKTTGADAESTESPASDASAIKQRIGALRNQIEASKRDYVEQHVRAARSAGADAAIVGGGVGAQLTPLQRQLSTLKAAVQSVLDREQGLKGTRGQTLPGGEREEAATAQPAEGTGSERPTGADVARGGSARSGTMGGVRDIFQETDGWVRHQKHEDARAATNDDHRADVALRRLVAGQQHAREQGQGSGREGVTGSLGVTKAGKSGNKEEGLGVRGGEAPAVEAAGKVVVGRGSGLEGLGEGVDATSSCDDKQGHEGDGGTVQYLLNRLMPDEPSQIGAQREGVSAEQGYQAPQQVVEGTREDRAQSKGRQKRRAGAQHHATSGSSMHAQDHEHISNKKSDQPDSSVSGESTSKVGGGRGRTRGRHHVQQSIHTVRMPGDGGETTRQRGTHHEHNVHGSNNHDHHDKQRERESRHKAGQYRGWRSDQAGKISGRKRFQGLPDVPPEFNRRSVDLQSIPHDADNLLKLEKRSDRVVDSRMRSEVPDNRIFADRILVSPDRKFPYSAPLSRRGFRAAVQARWYDMPASEVVRAVSRAEAALVANEVQRKHEVNDWVASGDVDNDMYELLAKGVVLQLRNLSVSDTMTCALKFARANYRDAGLFKCLFARVRGDDVRGMQHDVLRADPVYRAFLAGKELQVENAVLNPLPRRGGGSISEQGSCLEVMKQLAGEMGGWGSGEGVSVGTVQYMYSADGGIVQYNSTVDDDKLQQYNKINGLLSGLRETQAGTGGVAVGVDNLAPNGLFGALYVQGITGFLDVPIIRRVAWCITRHHGVHVLAPHQHAGAMFAVATLADRIWSADVAGAWDEVDSKKRRELSYAFGIKSVLRVMDNQEVGYVTQFGSDNQEDALASPVDALQMNGQKEVPQSTEQLDVAPWTPKRQSQDELALLAGLQERLLWQLRNPEVLRTYEARDWAGLWSTLGRVAHMEKARETVLGPRGWHVHSKIRQFSDRSWAQLCHAEGGGGTGGALKSLRNKKRRLGVAVPDSGSSALGGADSSGQAQQPLTSGHQLVRSTIDYVSEYVIEHSVLKRASGKQVVTWLHGLMLAGYCPPNLLPELVQQLQTAVPFNVTSVILDNSVFPECAGSTGTECPPVTTRAPTPNTTSDASPPPPPPSADQSPESSQTSFDAVRGCQLSVEDVIQSLLALGRLGYVDDDEALIGGVSMISNRQNLQFVSDESLRDAMEACLLLQIVDDGVWDALLGEFFRIDRRQRGERTQSLTPTELMDLLTLLSTSGMTKGEVYNEFLLTIQATIRDSLPRETIFFRKDPVIHKPKASDIVWINA